MNEIGKKIKSFKKRDLKMLSISKALSILRERDKLIKKKIQKKNYTKSMRK